MKRPIHFFLLPILLVVFMGPALSQTTQRKLQERCVTMPRLEQRLQRNPQLRLRFENQQRTFLRLLSQRTPAPGQAQRTGAVLTIPVVFHIVLPNPAIVTDAQVQAQLDTLNRSFFGSNGDSVRIPSYFKSFFGKSTIQFCLAQRTPEGEQTNGIVRTATSRTQFSFDDAVKSAADGGANSWNTDNYLNIWITSLSGGILGYATFPGDGAPAEQGLVVDYRSMPAGSYNAYNGGKTLVHEAGHFFNLYHIWGDDDGLCTGSDFVDDTPNQGNATDGCQTDIRTDNCTPTGNGIMYQNYMDYSFDPCLVMFTPGQISRMENAVQQFRPSLLRSNGCVPVIQREIDVQLRTIASPEQRLCDARFTPVVTIRNRGTQSLTSVLIQSQIDNGPVSSTTWSGNLATNASATVTLSGLTAGNGNHILTVYTTNPNARADEDKTNDTLRQAFQYFEPVTAVKEGFEATTFPPTAWDVVNGDAGPTWQRVVAIAKSGSASVKINNFDYKNVGEIDDLRLPQVNLPATLDSAFFSFEVAAATYTDINTANNVWDTLQVLVSDDCGVTYTSLYKKWGSTLVTRMAPETNAYVPVPGEWRRDSIDLAPFIGKSNLLLVFRNSTGYENNIYLDDITLRTVTINPNLKASGFLVTPNPARGKIAVQFFPQPTDLRSIQVFSVTGQKVFEQNVANGVASNYYDVDLSRYAPGMYVVRAVYDNRVVTKKIIKM